MASKAKKGKKEKKAKKGFQKVIFLKKEKETKGTIRYQEVDDAGEPIESDENGKVIGQQYIRKTAFGGLEPPDDLVVTITDNMSGPYDGDDEDEDE